MSLESTDQHHHPNCLAAHLSTQGPEWSSPAVNELFQVALNQPDPEHPPLCPHAITTLLREGNFEAVVGGLGYILSESALRDMWQERYGRRASINTILDQLCANPAVLPLTPAQECVVRMMHAIHSVGLDSVWHPSDRALEIIKPYSPQLDRGLPTSRFSLSFRVVGAASLIAAQGSLYESAAPSGIPVLRAAHDAGVPAVMLTAHHTLGGDAVPFVAEYLRNEGLLNGDISCPRLGYDQPNADIYWALKESPAEWTDSCARLAEKGLASGGRLLIVEDFGQHPFETPQKIELYKAMARGIQQSPLKHLTTHLARDQHEALSILHEGGVAGVVTDLYFPERLGSGSKELGDREVRRILGKFLCETDTELIMSQARSLECRVGAIVREEFEKLLTLA